MIQEATMAEEQRQAMIQEIQDGLSNYVLAKMKSKQTIDLRSVLKSYGVTVGKAASFFIDEALLKHSGQLLDNGYLPRSPFEWWHSDQIENDLDYELEDFTAQLKRHGELRSEQAEWFRSLAAQKLTGMELDLPPDPFRDFLAQEWS